jgi:hypothetical protein
LARLAFVLSLAFALAACGGGGANGGGAASKLDGAPEDILNQIIEEAGKALTDERPMPMSYVSEVTAETSQNAIGLSAADFDKYVTSASVATALIGSFAHEISLIQAKDAASVADIKKLITSDGGYNSMKWICVSPEQSCVIESGRYVLLAASRVDVVDAVVAAFTEAAGSVGERDIFFTSEKGAAEGGMAVGGGMALSPL